MQASTFIGLLEEMVDIKVQQQDGSSPENVPGSRGGIGPETGDRQKRRLDQIRAELIRILTT